MLGGGGGVSHPSQLTTGLVIKSVTTSPTLAGERMLFILQVSILSEQLGNWGFKYVGVQDRALMLYRVRDNIRRCKHKKSSNGKKPFQLIQVNQIFNKNKGIMSRIVKPRLG